MKVDWKLQIGDPSDETASLPYSGMNEILSFVQPENSFSIFACGYAWVDPNSREGTTASMYRMDEDGEVGLMYRWGDRTDINS